MATSKATSTRWQSGKFFEVKVPAVRVQPSLAELVARRFDRLLRTLRVVTVTLIENAMLTVRVVCVALVGTGATAFWFTFKEYYPPPAPPAIEGQRDARHENKSKAERADPAERSDRPSTGEAVQKAEDTKFAPAGQKLGDGEADDESEALDSDDTQPVFTDDRPLRAPKVETSNNSEFIELPPLAPTTPPLVPCDPAGPNEGPAELKAPAGESPRDERDETLPPMDPAEGDAPPDGVKTPCPDIIASRDVP